MEKARAFESTYALVVACVLAVGSVDILTFPETLAFPPTLTEPPTPNPPTITAAPVDDEVLAVPVDQGVRLARYLH
jgi:hypothetical protein